MLLKAIISAASSDQPVDEQSQEMDGVGLAAALLQEAVDAGLLGHDVEVDRAQHADDRESRCLRDQPADDEDQDGQQHVRQEGADLMQRLAYRLEQNLHVIHRVLRFVVRVCCAAGIRA